MEQLDLPLDYLDDKPNKDKIEKNREVFSRVTFDVLSKVFDYKFNHGKYTSYKIEVENDKIKKIKFKIGEYKFLVYIDYDIFYKNIRQINFSETDPDDRETSIKSINIKNLKISAIQQKTKAGYGVYKTSVNYFRFTGIDYQSIKSFLEELIKNYHKTN